MWSQEIAASPVNTDSEENRPSDTTTGRALATRLKFWGVRGSIPVPGRATLRYGGNTSCVEVRAAGQIIVLDAGTGVRALGLVTPVGGGAFIAGWIALAWAAWRA